MVGGLTPMTTIDFPGELAAVIFCQGCPWRCHYCHNPELLSCRGEREIPWGEVHDFLKQRQGLLDGVVFSGGEPTLQRSLAQAVDQAKNLGFKVGLHTSGAYPKRLANLLPMIDWVGLDIKALPEKYTDLTGVPGSGERAWESASRVIDSGVGYEIRTTYHPDLYPVDDLEQIVSRLDLLGAKNLKLQQCILPPPGTSNS